MRIAAIIVACAFATPAQADWQYTRWGMTLPELQAASPAGLVVRDLPRHSTPQSTIRASSTYEASGMRFTARFGFDQRSRLNRVSLTLSDASQCSALRESLRSVYGWPDVRNQTRAFNLDRWRDVRGGQMITLLSIGEGMGPTLATCDLDYTPIVTREESGL